MKLTRSSRNLHIVVVILGSFMCSYRAPAAESGPGERPMLRVPATDATPAVDGKLDEPCWKDAARTGPLRVTQGKPAKPTTEAFLLRDADCLYVGVSCAPNDAVKGKVEPGKPSKAVDCVELMIDSNGDRNSYYLLRITSENGGKISSSYNEHTPPWYDRTWQPPLKFAVARSAGAWAVELALPFEIFNKNKTLATKIGFNIRRSGIRGGEIQCWSGTFEDPGSAGELTGIPARDAMPAPEYGVKGLERWINPAQKNQRLFLDREAKRTIELGPGSAHPGTTGEVRIELEGYLLAADPHECAFIWDIALDERKGELYVLSDSRGLKGMTEIRVFDRQGRYLRTIMPFNPAMACASVQDICWKTARENGTELLIPKTFNTFGGASFYGEYWHLPQKMALTPDGDLLLSNIGRGIIWRMRNDGGLPEQWTSIYHRGRNEPFDSAAWSQAFWRTPDVKNYMPFSALHYPCFCFDDSGLLYVSSGRACWKTMLFAYHWEITPKDRDRAGYHWPVDGSSRRDTRVWKCRIDGVRIADCVSWKDFHEPCGLVLDKDNLIVADSGNNRLQVLDRNGRLMASITSYEHQGNSHPIYDPTALAIDSDGALYVLAGCGPKPEYLNYDHDTLGGLSRRVIDNVENRPGVPARKLLKFDRWRQMNLMAKSGPLHSEAMQIAVDNGNSPPQVWVANGAGSGSLLLLDGRDLSVRNQWSDNGDTLSFPEQGGGMPILNVDPGTGHLYVEDKSNYRLKQFGSVYRLDQEGDILKKWPSLYFLRGGAPTTSFLGSPDYELQFRYPDEPLFIDSFFGKDGRIYRWRATKTKVELLRFDREGTPVPFRSSGTNILQVDRSGGLHPARAEFYHGMDVDRHGRIYYVAKAERAGNEVRRRVDVYSARGELTKKGLLTLEGVRDIQVDDDGLYALHKPGDKPWNDFLAISKFRLQDGKRLWSRMWEGYVGISELARNDICQCNMFRFHQALDGKGYLYAAGQHSIQAINCETGKLVGEFGSYGNMDCKGKGSAYPHPELPFGTISALSVWKDRLFVVDVLNRRIVKCRIVYGKVEKQGP